MSSEPMTTASAGRPLGPGGVALILMLCLSWGFNAIAVKLALPDIPPIMQALIRSAGALPVMLIVGWLRGVNFLERDGSLVPGLVAGLLFGIEFVLIFTGLALTSASRAAVFLYTAPFFVALGLLSVSRRAAERVAMERIGLELRRRRTRDRRAAAERRRQGIAGRSPGGMRRRAVGGDHADRQGNAAAQRRAGKGTWLPGGGVDPDHRRRLVVGGRNHDPCPRRAGDSR